MKKILAVTMALAMVFCFVACGNKDAAASGVASEVTSGVVLVDMSQCELTQDEMLASLESLATVLANQMNAVDENAALTVEVADDGKVSFVSVGSLADEDGNVTGVSDPVTVAEFDSIEAAFEAFANDGLIGLDGKLIGAEDTDLLEQPIAAFSEDVSDEEFIPETDPAASVVEDAASAPEEGELSAERPVASDVSSVEAPAA